MAGMFDEGESLLRAMLRDDSLRTGSVENNLATVLYIQGQYDAAAELHQAAIDREPTDSLFYRNLGDDLWHMSGDADAEPVFIRAIEVAEQQLNINPNEELALSALMVAYASIGDSTSFERAKERVLDLYATNPYTHFDIAVGAARLEDLDTARIHTEKARELGYPEALLKADPDINLGE